MFLIRFQSCTGSQLASWPRGVAHVTAVGNTSWKHERNPFFSLRTGHYESDVLLHFCVLQKSLYMTFN